MKSTEMMVCRCEEVSYQTLVDTAQKYNCTARELKLRTRAAMGYCGGRTCRCMVDQIANSVSGEKNNRQISLKYQPPIRPIQFGQLGRDEA